METDPKNSDYVVKSGAKRKVEVWDANEEVGVIPLATEEEKDKLALDPIYKLEHENEDKKKAENAIPALQSLMKFQEERTKDDYSVNSLLRKRFREEKKKK